MIIHCRPGVFDHVAVREKIAFARRVRLWGAIEKWVQAIRSARDDAAIHRIAAQRCTNADSADRQISPAQSTAGIRLITSLALTFSMQAWLFGHWLSRRR